MHSHLNLGLSKLLTAIGLHSDIYEDTYDSYIQAIVSNGQKAKQEGDYMKVEQLAILRFNSQLIHYMLQEC